MSNHIEDFISAYVDNELSEEERQQVEDHLENCLQCRAILSNVMDIKSQIFAAFHSIEVPETIENDVLQAIGFGNSANTSKQRYWLFVPLFTPLLFIAITFVLMGSFVLKIGSVMMKVVFNLIYALGSILGSDPYTIIGLIGFSMLLIISSSVSLNHLLKTKAIEGDSI
ncbi:MAG: zf-HC2 domain-containing protein [Paenibacillaceae bacterium]